MGYDELGTFVEEEFTVVRPAPATPRGSPSRCAVAAAPVIVHGVLVKVLHEHREDLTDLLTAADRPLYQAKAPSRNQVAMTR